MDERQFLVLTGLGPDRPGIAAELSAAIADAGCNIEESRMAVLGGEFGILCLIAGPPDRVKALLARVSDIESRTHLRITHRQTTNPTEHRKGKVVPYTVRAHALDHEGIVHAITEILYKLGANVVSLDTSSYNAPVTGSPLFRLEVLADVPAEVQHSRLAAQLEEVAQRENLEIEVHAA